MCLSETNCELMYCLMRKHKLEEKCPKRGKNWITWILLQIALNIDRLITDKENNIKIRQILVYNTKNFIYDRVQRKT